MSKVSRAGRVARKPLVVIALPFAYREGVDEYNGVMRYVRERGADWSLRIVRHSFGPGLFRDFPVGEIDGVICGMNTRPGIAGYELYFDEGVLDLLAAAKVPVVGIDLPVSPCRGKMFASVSLDSERIGRKAAQYLSKTGEYAAFGFVGAFSDRTWSRDRGAFFARELRRIGKREISIFGGVTERCDESLLEWLKALPKPAAVFASNDHCAGGILRICAEGGVRVPDDLAVLGVDDDPIFCIHTSPSLTSIHPDFEAEGYIAARTLATMMRGRRPPALRLVSGEMTISERMSTAPCAPSGRLVRRADEIIAERACAGLTTEMLAGMLGVSRRLLDLRYRQIDGKSVHEAIENVRMAKAQSLLSGTRLLHREIAELCGYRSNAYMEHVFMRRFGLTMSEYRRSRAEK